MFTITVRVATRRRAASRPRARAPRDLPASGRGATVASLWAWGKYLTATAGGGDPVPGIHRQQVPRRLPLAAFGLLECGKLPVVFPSAGFQLETHHPTDVLRPDQVFVDRGLPTMPLLVSAPSHSEVSGNHTTRCPTTVGRPADGKENGPPGDGP